VSAEEQFFFGLFNDYGYRMMVFSSSCSVMASISKFKQNNVVTISVHVTICDPTKHTSLC
jgi:hypothetical protein